MLIDLLADPVVGEWAAALEAALRVAKADRARELRGDRSAGFLDKRGLHTFSLEWGRLQACEALLPGLSELRDVGPELTSSSVRSLAYREAERDFADELGARGAGEVFSAW